MQVKVLKLKKNAILPRYAHPGDAGADVFAAGHVVIEPGATALVPTGIAIELPHGYEAQVRPRSGLALKHSVSVLNTPGTIDAGYRGEVGVIMINHGREPFEINPGDRIAQMVIKPVLEIEMVEAETLSDTSRGAGGFGSTGRQ